MKDPAHLKYVRGLNCCRCGASWPSTPHHHAHAGSGVGLKADDKQVIPLCNQCHTDFHGNTGQFDRWPRSALKAWQDAQVELVWAKKRPDKVEGWVPF